MEYILIGVLFIFQLISFYFIVLLNAKISKYKDLEQKQRRLIEEMDNSIGVYLLEMKEENDRLIQELQATSSQQRFEKSNSRIQQDALYEPLISKATSLTEKKVATVPKTVAANMYERNIDSQTMTFAQDKVTAILNGIEKEQQPLTFEQKVRKMFDEGQSIEQIAKNTNKGKTEIELLLKFSS